MCFSLFCRSKKPYREATEDEREFMAARSAQTYEQKNQLRVVNGGLSVDLTRSEVQGFANLVQEKAQQAATRALEKRVDSLTEGTEEVLGASQPAAAAAAAAFAFVRTRITQGSTSGSTHPVISPINQMPNWSEEGENSEIVMRSGAGSLVLEDVVLPEDLKAPTPLQQNFFPDTPDTSL